MTATLTTQGPPRVLAAPAPLKTITCTAAVALMLASTRWGSYIGANPLFLTDVLIVGSILDRMLGRSRYAMHPVLPGFRDKAPVLLLLLFGYVIVRMLFSGSYALSVTWLRDGAPYLYVVLGVVSARSLARAPAESRARTMKWVWWALVFHLVWVCGISVVGSAATFAAPRPFFSGGIFDARPDIDSAVLGITAGLLVRRALLGQRRALAVVGLGGVAFAAATFTSRAGFIAIAVCCLLGFAYAYAASGRIGLRRIGMILTIPVVLLAAVNILPSTTVGSRLEATIDPSHASSAAQANAVGTTDARRKTWNGVITWTRSDNTRVLVGAGMGVDFLAASGTLQYLEGTDYVGVRSPHDYFIGSFARLGLIGLGLLLAIVLSLIRRAYSYRRRIAEDELLTFAALTVFGVVSVASFGVVLEAPFGAVPFWWAAGLLLALAPIRTEADTD